jgi:hypothetical protein
VSKLSDKIGAFVTIPNTLFKMMDVIGIDAFVLFCYLRYRTNGETGKAFPSYNTIQADTSLTRRRIAAAIRWLEQYDLVERRKRFGQSSHYILKIPNPRKRLPTEIAPFPDPALVQHMDCISPDAGLSLVQGVHTNKIEPNKIEKEYINSNSQYPMMVAIADACCMDIQVNQGQIGNEAKKLTSAGYRPEQITKSYCGATSWWATKDWRGKQGQTPNIATINQTIKEATDSTGPKIIRL